LHIDENIRTNALRVRWLLAAEQVQEKGSRLALLLKANFSPAQPRVPRGNPDGGQWTRVGGLDGETSVEPLRVGQQVAQVGTQIDISTDALTGISRIDENTVNLVKALASVVDTVGLVTGDPLAYGRAIHLAFAGRVRLAGFPGIGFFDVETTFGLEPDVYYGAKGTVRTDVVVRNDAGEIIAIYDVKTGSRGLSSSRVRELRTKTRSGLSVPIIELSLVHGISLKQAFEQATVLVRRTNW
jgi:hypothetical protein